MSDFRKDDFRDHEWLASGQLLDEQAGESADAAAVHELKHYVDLAVVVVGSVTVYQKRTIIFQESYELVHKLVALFLLVDSHHLNGQRDFEFAMEGFLNVPTRPLS